MKKIIVLILCLFAFTIKVNAKTYNTGKYGTNTAYLYPSGTVNFDYNTNANNGYIVTYMDLFTFIVDKDNGNGLTSGRYLVDLYIVSPSNLISGTQNCYNFATDFSILNYSTGAWISSTSTIKSGCVNSYLTHYNGVAAHRYLLEFTLDGINDPVDTLLRMRVANYGNGLVGPNGTFKVVIGSIQDFDSSIVSDFNSSSNANTEINQNQTIIDQNKETNDLIGGESDDITSKSCGMICKLKAVINFINPLSENFFAYKLVELMLNMLKSLFIPEDMDFVTNFVEALESKLGFIAAIPVKIIEFTMSLATATWSEFKSIQLPSISIFGYNFWNAQEIDLTEAINIFKPFKYVTDCICVVICAQTLNKWREKFTGGGSGK